MVNVKISLKKLISSSHHNFAYLEQNQTTKQKHTHNNRCQVSVQAYLQHRIQLHYFSANWKVTDTRETMENYVPKKNKQCSDELDNPMISLECPQKEELDPSKYIAHTCHKTLSNFNSGKYVIEILLFDYDTPEE